MYGAVRSADLYETVSRVAAPVMLLLEQDVGKVPIPKDKRFTYLRTHARASGETCYGLVRWNRTSGLSA